MTGEVLEAAGCRRCLLAVSEGEWVRLQGEERQRVRRTEDKESGVELAVVDAGWRVGAIVTAAKSEVRLLLQVRRPMGATEGEHGRAA